MRFSYCPDCGSRLVEKPIGDEGPTPYCEHCRKPLFDMFSTCVISLVVNELDEAALLRQDYISTVYRNLVSGYMKPGETAESAAEREILEELGLPVTALDFAGTYWFGKKGMLMIGFIARAKKADFILSGEVQEAEWVPAERALGMVHPRGSTSYALVERFLSRREGGGA